MQAPGKCRVPGMIHSLASPHCTGESSGGAPYPVLEVIKHLLQEAFQAQLLHHPALRPSEVLLWWVRVGTRFPSVGRREHLAVAPSQGLVRTELPGSCQGDTQQDHREPTHADPKC